VRLVAFTSYSESPTGPGPALLALAGRHRQGGAPGEGTILEKLAEIEPSTTTTLHGRMRFCVQIHLQRTGWRKYQIQSQLVFDGHANDEKTRFWVQDWVQLTKGPRNNNNPLPT
jgi:hypothetical protein